MEKSKAPLTLPRWIMVITLLWSIATQSVVAHPMPQSMVVLDFFWDSIHAELTLPLDRLEIGFQKKLTNESNTVLNQYSKDLSSYVLQHVKPVTPDGRDWLVSVQKMHISEANNQSAQDLIVDLVLTPPQGAPLDKLTLNYDVISHQLVTHTALITVRQDWRNHQYGDKPETLGAIRFGVSSVNIDRTQGSLWSGFNHMIGLGARHILEGFDHLLFLLLLLIIAPVSAEQGRWRRNSSIRVCASNAVKLVTAFTLGHSLTLIVGTFGWITLPSQVVEIAIAGTVLVTAFHVIKPRFAGYEAVLVTGFGLIHGLAFASTLSLLTADPNMLALSIFGFNLGIELVQIAMISVSIPVVYLISTVTRCYAPIRFTTASCGIVAALLWIIERSGTIAYLLFSLPSVFQ